MRPSHKLHILCTASWYPHRDIPTLGNFVQRHVEAIAALHDVTVLYVASSKDIQAMRVEDETIRGVRTIIVYTQRGMRAHIRAFHHGLGYLMKDQSSPFDIIHHHVAWPHIWQAVQLGKKWGIPTVLTEHWTGFDHKRKHEMKWWQRAFLKRMLNRVNVICPVSQQLGESMKAFGATAKQCVIPNVVNTEIFHPPTAKPARAKQFLHVSTLNDDHKNIRGLLSAWKAVCEQVTDWTLVIGGDGPVAQVKTWAEQAGIPTHNMAYFGESSSLEIADKMRQSDAFVLFSRYENLPCVLLEAMACGLHIISTQVGGIREHVHASFGTLIASEDEAALTEAMLQFIHHSDQPLVNTDAQHYAASHFSMDAIAQQYDQVYRDLGR